MLMIKPHITRLASLFLVTLLVTSGCGPAPIASTTPKSGGGKLTVVCTTGMVADLVKNIGGDRVAVTALMGPGVDPHLYKTSQGDVKLLQEADVIFFSGLHLEGKMAEVLERLAQRKTAVAVTSGIPKEKLLTSEGEEADPHVWFDVSLWMLAAEKVHATLVKQDAASASGYNLRYEAYKTQLSNLHESVKKDLQTIDKKKRVLVTAHDAFRYFGKAYDVEVMGIQGISTESEASVKHVNDLVEYLVKNQIKAVFVENSVPEKNIQALVDGCKAKGHQVSIGGELCSDAMGPEGSPSGTYVGMVKVNVETIVKALK